LSPGPMFAVINENATIPKTTNRIKSPIIAKKSLNTCRNLDKPTQHNGEVLITRLPGNKSSFVSLKHLSISNRVRISFSTDDEEHEIVAVL
jgi:hypothetical protein